MSAPLGQDVRGIFDAAPMSRAQVAAVLVTVLLSALDGYDVLSVTFAAPAVTHAWGVGKAALGVVLSSGLVGMAVGSLLLAPLADIVGRRPVVLGGLALMAAGAALSAFAHSVTDLALWRVLTGLGIGVMVAVITPLAAEFANARHRPFAVTAMAVGYPLGGVAGGLCAAVLLARFGWPSVFLVGAGVALLLIPAVLLFLPEPPAFLLARRRPDGLRRINALLARCGHAPVDALPIATVATGGYRALFAPGSTGVVVRLTIANLLYVMTVYYVLSWLPQMVADAGFAPSTASLVSAVSNLAGAAGGLALGLAARRAGLPRLVVLVFLGLGLSTAAFGFTPSSLPLLMIAAGVCGFFLFSGIAGLYATLATTFSAEARASGSGLVIGVGRASSAAGPYLAGWMFAAGLSRGQVSLAFGLCALVAGVVLAIGARRGAPRRRPF